MKNENNKILDLKSKKCTSLSHKKKEKEKELKINKIFFTLIAFVGAYGGGFVDYFISGIISLIFFELFPLLWSLVITLLFYFGSRNIEYKTVMNVEFSYFR